MQSGEPAKFKFVDIDIPVRETTVKVRQSRYSNAQRGCDACSMKEQWAKLKTPRMAISGTPDADVLIIGEAPGEEEDRIGRPFVGPAGGVLQDVLQRVLPRGAENRIAMTNSIRCHPPRNRDPTAQELHACSLHLETDIAGRNIKAILGLGAVTLSRFLTGAGITQIHGLKFPVQIGGKVLWYFPTFHPSYILHTGESRGSYDQSPALPVFENDIKRFFAEIDTWPEPVIEEPDPQGVVCVYTEDEAMHWLDQIDWTIMGGRDHPVGLDIETNQLRPNTQSSLIMSAAVSDGALAVAWPIMHPEAANHWGLPLLLNLSRYNRWVAHHAGFELAWLTEFGKQVNWAPEQGFDDSMATARLFQRRESCLGLGILTRIYTGTNIKTLSTIDAAKIASEPLKAVLGYNGLDSWGCWRIFDELGPQVKSSSRPDCNYQSILDTIASTTAMQLTGLDIDRSAAFELREYWQAEANAAAQHAGTTPEVQRYVDERCREFNIGSGDQVGEALVAYSNLSLPRNKDGTYKTDDKTLTELAPDSPLVLDALRFRHARKMDSTYIEPIVSASTQYVDGRIYPSYSTMLTRTLRLSSEAPNIQNFPRRKDREVRRSIVPPKGCIWASADFGQLEARIFAAASRDRVFCKSIIDRQDIHKYWLNKILDRYPAYMDRLRSMVSPNDTEEQIRKGGRDIIKSDWTFALFYGSTAKNVTERTGLPYDIVMDLMSEFWGRQHYSGAHAWLKRQRQQYRETGMTVDLFGRCRYGAMFGNEPINTPIQGSAARVVLDAQNELHRMAIEDNDPYLLPRINIHDDLVFSLPDDPVVIEAYIDGISEILVKVRYDFQIVPLMVEWKIGSNWADLTAVHEFVGDYVK